MRTTYRNQPDQRQGLLDWWAASTGIHRMIEVGSAFGDSAAIWMKCNPDLELWTVDPWNDADMLASFHAKHSGNLHVHEVRAVSVAAPPMIAAIAPVDAVYIDAVHDYANVSADIKAWRKFIRPGGWIGGHDYNRLKFPGCVRAVNEAFGGPDRVFCDTSWLVRLEAES